MGMEKSSTHRKSIMKDYIDPDLVDILADSDVPGPIADRLLIALNKRLDNGVDISEIELELMNTLKLFKEESFNLSEAQLRDIFANVKIKNKKSLNCGSM